MVDQDTVAVPTVPTGFEHTPVGIGVDGVTVVGGDIKAIVETPLPGDGVDPPAVTAGDSLALYDPVVDAAPPGNSGPGTNADERIGGLL